MSCRACLLLCICAILVPTASSASIPYKVNSSATSGVNGGSDPSGFAAGSYVLPPDGDLASLASGMALLTFYTQSVCMCLSPQAQLVLCTCTKSLAIFDTLLTNSGSLVIHITKWMSC